LPTLLLHGTNDGKVPLAQAIELERLLHRHGTPTRLVVVAGAGHNFMGSAGFTREAAFAQVLSFLLNRVVKPSLQGR
jgi:dipeptidyl aminopeptidase/acylaminoacyl peptidase